MLIKSRNEYTELATTIRRLRAERAAIILPGVECLRKPARVLTGRPAVRHHVATERADTRPAPRTVRTTHTGQRVIMRRTGRLI